MGGAADPGGAWAYGLLEVFDGETFLRISDAAKNNHELGRRGAQVACRTLGFVTGGQAIDGEESALADTDGRDRPIGNILCNGDEARLSDCELYEFTSRGLDDYDGIAELSAVALVCYTPSGADSLATPEMV